VIKSPNVISFFGLMFITDMMTSKRFGFYGVKPYLADSPDGRGAGSYRNT